MMRFRWITIVFLFIFSVESYGQRRNQPEWVTATPVDNWSYYGIGIASTEDTDYRNKARVKALKEISEKIFVSIDSESNLRMSYSNADTRYELDEDITTITGNRLEGYEKVADWQDRRENIYYVLFKLDKDLYADKRALHVERTLEQIKYEKDRAQKFFLMEDYTSAFSYLESALSMVEEELNRYPEPDFAYQLKIEQDEIGAYYEDRISRVKIVVQNKQHIFDPLSGQETTISFKVEDRLSGKNLTNFPVKLHMLSGDVFDYEVQYGADSSEIHVYGLLPDKGDALLRIQPDLSGDYLEKNDLLSQLVNFAESGTIEVSFVPYAVYFENSSQENTSDISLRAFFSNFLRFCSIRTTDDPTEGQYTVVLNSEIYFTPSEKGIITELEGDLLVKRSDGSIAFKTSLTKVRAVGSSHEISQKLAIESLFRSVDAPLQQIIQFFCGQKH